MASMTSQGNGTQNFEPLKFKSLACVLDEGI